MFINIYSSFFIIYLQLDVFGKKNFHIQRHVKEKTMIYLYKNIFIIILILKQNLIHFLNIHSKI